jgi:hypothetical protein
MKQANAMNEDMFEKARETFFETGETSPKPSAPSPEFPKPRNAPQPKKTTAPSKA